MRIWSLVLGGACLVGVAHVAAAQDAVPAPTTQSAEPTAVPAPAAALVPSAEPAAQAPAAANPAAVPAAQAATPEPAAQAAAPEPAAQAAPQAAEPAAQAATPTPEPAAQTSEPAAAAAAAQAAPATPAAAQATPAATAAADPAKAATPTPKRDADKFKSKKVEYTGPTTVIVLAPTPMLDEEGKQRMDPDGKLMFNPPVAQQRDKKGHPMFDEQGKPIFQTKTELGYDEHGHHLQVKKEKPPKMTPVTISRGTFTVDGMIGKAELNYDIADLKYIYLYAPSIGTVVVSNDPFPGAVEEPKAFNDTTLTVTVGDHILQVASDKRLLSKKPEPAYVLLDRNFKLPSKYPVVGYGVGLKAPYTWPGGRPNAAIATVADIKPPPTPTNLRPVMLLQPCPAGQMRKAAPPALPGEVAPEQPCVPIPKSLPVQTAVAPKPGAASAPAVTATPAGVTPAAAAPEPAAAPAPTPEPVATPGPAAPTPAPATPQP